jgi:RNA polymerase sigma-70 factor (ECF subfamily)
MAFLRPLQASTHPQKQPKHDQHLASQAVAGDATAFAALLNTHYDTLFRIALKYSQHPDMAADIVQNACIKIAQSIGGFRFNSQILTWMIRIVINEATDQIRSQKPTDDLDDYLHLGHAADQETTTLAQQVLSCIHDLPTDLMDAAVLVWINGHTHKEAAKVLGIAEGTVSWRLNQARKLLPEITWP